MNDDFVNSVAVVLVLDGHPAANMRDAKEVLNRTSTGYTGTPELEDPDAGMWLVNLDWGIVSDLKAEGEVERHNGHATLYATWPDA